MEFRHVDFECVHGNDPIVRNNVYVCIHSNEPFLCTISPTHKHRSIKYRKLICSGQYDNTSFEFDWGDKWHRSSLDCGAGVQCQVDSAEYTSVRLDQHDDGDADCRRESRDRLDGDDRGADGLSDGRRKLGCHLNIEPPGSGGRLDTELGTTGADSGIRGNHVGNTLCGDVQLDKFCYGTTITGCECVGNTRK